MLMYWHIPFPRLNIVIYRKWIFLYWNLDNTIYHSRNHSFPNGKMKTMKYVIIFFMEITDNWIQEILLKEAFKTCFLSYFYCVTNTVADINRKDNLFNMVTRNKSGSEKSGHGTPWIVFQCSLMCRMVQLSSCFKLKNLIDILVIILLIHELYIVFNFKHQQHQHYLSQTRSEIQNVSYGGYFLPKIQPCWCKLNS
jgi:hypothetical protein